MTAGEKRLAVFLADFVMEKEKATGCLLIIRALEDVFRV